MSQEVGKGADIIGLPDPNNLFISTDIGGAMQELFINVSNSKRLVGGAIADVDDSIMVPTDLTLMQLVNLIKQISTGKKWASGITVTTTKQSFNLVPSDGKNLCSITVGNLSFQQ